MNVSWASDPDYRLVWPRELLRAELRQLVGPPAAAVDSFSLLFEEAFAGPQPVEDLRQATQDKVSHDSALTWSGVIRALGPAAAAQFGRRILDALDHLPTQQPRRYWSERKRAPDRPDPADRWALQNEWLQVVANLTGLGYLARLAGDDCPDADGPGFDEQIRELIADRLGRPVEDDDWPGTDRPWDFPRDDDAFCDLVEMMHELVARPRARATHDFYRHHHHSDFSRATGQAVYRWRVNDLLDRYDVGLQVAENGEDVGMLVQAVADPRRELLSQVLQDIPDGNDDRVSHATMLYRGRNATPEDKRRACRELADVLESRRKAVLEHYLVDKDSGALFAIANGFAIRHHRDDQMYGYDEAFLDWIFWWCSRRSSSVTA